MPELRDREKHEKRIAAELAPWLSEQERELLDLLGPEFLLANVPEDYWREKQQSVLPGLALILAGIFAASVSQLPEEEALFIPLDTQAVTRNASRWAREYSGELISNITQTTRQEVAGKVADAISLGWDTDQLQEALASQFGPTRAALIAQTETTAAASEGEIQAVAEFERQYQIHVEAVWETHPELSATGPCPICEPLDGTVQGTAWYLPPPAHPRCVCAMRYRKAA